jgi:hypothetical protein
MGLAPSGDLIAEAADRERRERATCPACQGSGRIADQQVQFDDPPCGVCRGFGWVLPNALCICGRSPNMELAGILFCGKDACLKAIRDRKTLAGYVTNYCDL